MEEFTNHIIYELLKNKYSKVGLDFVVFPIDEYMGIETHKKAVIKALKIVGKRQAYEYSVIPDKMEALLTDIDKFLELPDDDYDNKKKRTHRGWSMPKSIPYWYAFLEPPYGNRYLIKDFVEFNEALFPNRHSVDVYRWNDDFSDYFDAGKEWWGTAFWSVYDKTTNILVIVGASLTD